MIKENLHTHTVFSDGGDSPREMADHALQLGFTTLGFSDHSFTSIDTSYCIRRENVSRYKEAIAALSGEYEGRLRILCGIEQDYYADDPASDYDYVIGSVHYVERLGSYMPIDHSPRMFLSGTVRLFAGDFLAVCEAYYSLVRQVVEKTDCDIIGHFDLVTKFNEGESYFSQDNPRYKKAALDALDALLAENRPFEINTGAMARGYRSVPYPAPEWIDYIISRGGKLILSSDCHDKALLDHGFAALAEKYAKYLISFDCLKENRT